MGAEREQKKRDALFRPAASSVHLKYGCSLGHGQLLESGHELLCDRPWLTGSYDPSVHLGNRRNLRRSSGDEDLIRSVEIEEAQLLLLYRIAPDLRQIHDCRSGYALEVVDGMGR